MTTSDNPFQTYIISPKDLFVILKRKLDASDDECKEIEKDLEQFGIGKGCTISLNVRKKTKNTNKKVIPWVVNKKNTVTLKNLSYAAATTLILKEHGPLNAKHLYEYVKAYGWVCKKGGKTPKSTFGAMLSTGVAQGKFTRVKGEDGHYIYSVAEAFSPILEL